MKFTTTREGLLRPLQLVTGVVQRRQILPVLSNLLIRAENNALSITGTDLEVELSATATQGVEIEQEGSVTIPARKMADIWRSLPAGAKVSVAVEGDRAIVRSGRSRFALSILPSNDFPAIETVKDGVEIRLERDRLHNLIEQTSFAMAQQDVRYFLNGMLLEVTPDHVRTVATDGHRLAMSTLDMDTGVDAMGQVIVPRKGVVELNRVLAESEDPVVLSVGKNQLTAAQGEYSLTTKLVDGKFPDYEKVIPEASETCVLGDRETLKQAFHRASILSNEKYRGVRLVLDGDQLTIQANNPEQEEAEEVVAVEYPGEHLEIGFNVGYLQDVLGVLNTDSVQISVADANSSALIEGPGLAEALYVVMPMRL